MRVELFDEVTRLTQCVALALEEMNRLVTRVVIDQDERVLVVTDDATFERANDVRVNQSTNV